MSAASMQDRLKRLLFLIPYVAKRGAKGMAVSRVLDIAGYRSPQEFYEDVRLIEMIGPPSGSPDEFIDIAVENGSVYITLPLGFSRPPRFTVMEAASLLAAADPLRHEPEGVLDSAVKKLRKALPPGSEEALQEHVRSTAVQGPLHSRWREVLAEAIARRMEVTLEYFAAYKGKPARRVVEPRMLFPHTKHWYLAAWSVADQKEKLYRLDRIVSAEVGARCFGEHKGDRSRRYDRTVLFYEEELLPEVEIRFEAELAPLALEQWGSLARQNGDGSVTVKTRMASQEYAVNWALGYSGQVSFVAPEEWQQALEERGKKLLARHRPWERRPMAGPARSAARTYPFDGSRADDARRARPS